MDDEKILTTEERKEGIETIKQLTKDAIETGLEFHKDYEDKVISKGEWLSKVDNIIAIGRDLFKFQKLLAEIKDFKTDEAVEYVLYITTFGLVKEDAKQLALYVIEVVEAEISIYNKSIKPAIELIKKMTEKKKPE